MFQRAIAKTDIASGTVRVGPRFVTRGPAQSTYREGNSTVQNSVLHPNALYNTQTNRPTNITAQSNKKRTSMTNRPRKGKEKSFESWKV